MKKEINKGQTFKFLTILKEVDSIRSGKKMRRRVLVRCVCGVERVMFLEVITSPKKGATSCGCKRIEKVKKALKKDIRSTDHRLYGIYQNMKTRCYYKRAIT